MARTPKSPASIPATRKPRSTGGRSRTTAKPAGKPAAATPAAKVATAKPVPQRAKKPAPEAVPETTPATAPAAIPEATPEPAGTPPLVAVAVPQLRKRELVERVAGLSGVKKKDVKAVVEATLAVLGDALAAGEELNLPPLGKARINRQKDGARGRMMVIRLRRNTGEESAQDPLAAPAD